MYRFIDIEDLVANALIEIIERKNICKVSFKQLNEYGKSIVNWFKKSNKKVVILISQYYIDKLKSNFSDFFEIYDSDASGYYIELKSTKTVWDLRFGFRSYLSTDMLMAFTHNDNLQKLIQ